jgi:hypothetical protein
VNANYGNFIDSLAEVKAVTGGKGRGVTMFERIISIDWSGAAEETDRVDLRVAVWDKDSGVCRIKLPPAGGRTRSWRRDECRQYIRDSLVDRTRALIGMDFGFGLPWGSDRVIFGASGWRDMLRRVGQLYSVSRTARATAQVINSMEQFGGHGPFRFNDSRADFRFYLANDIAYFRLTELAAPQAISQWYLGSGGTVGFHTITGLSAIDWLIGLRERGESRFAIWPFESFTPEEHVVVETYPAICPRCPIGPECRGGDEEDAWRVLKMLVARNEQGTLAELFEIPEQRFGRVCGIDFKMQIDFEGWILGIKHR